MAKLKLSIPDFNLKRYAKVSLGQKNGKEFVAVNGVDEANCPYQIFKSIKINGEQISTLPLRPKEQETDSVYKMKFEFQGFYNEPTCEVSIPRSLLKRNGENNGDLRIQMIYNPYLGDNNKGQWEFVMGYDFHTQEALEPLQFVDGRAFGLNIAKQFDKKANISAAPKKAIKA